MNGDRSSPPRAARLPAGGAGGRRVPAKLLVLCLIAATAPFWDMGHPLWEVDDARYAEVPREMAESGDWLTPRLNYVDYLEKPPLIYWLGAWSYRLLGVGEAQARLPLALLSLSCLIGTAWFGGWLFAPKTGLYAAVMLAGCVQFAVLSHLQTPDMALSAALLWGSAFLLRGMKFPEDAPWAGPAAGACMGLAFLSKGLVGFLFPVLWAAGSAALFPELRRGARAVLRSAALPAMALTVLPWLWGMASRHPGFLRHFFIEHHLQRYLTPQFNRQGAWYYFLGVDLGGLLPWTPLALAALAAAALDRRPEGRASRQLLLWVGLILAFFSPSNSKVPTYILPIFPHQCLIMAGFLRRVEDSPAWHARLKRLAFALGAAVLGCIPILLYLTRSQGWPAGLPPSLRVTCLAALAILALGLLSPALKTGRDAGFSTLRRAGLCAFALTGLMLLGARQAGPLLSVKELSRKINERRRPGDRIVTYDAYLHGIAFYTGRAVDVVNWTGEFYYRKRDPRYRDRFGDDTLIRGIEKGAGNAFVALPVQELPYFSTLVAPGGIRSLQISGHLALVRVQGARPASAPRGGIAVAR